MPLVLLVCCSASCRLLGRSVAQALQSSFLLLTWERATKKTNYSGSGRSLLTDIYPMERAGCVSGVLQECCELMYTPDCGALLIPLWSRGGVGVHIGFLTWKECCFAYPKGFSPDHKCFLGFRCFNFSYPALQERY